MQVPHAERRSASGTAEPASAAGSGAAVSPGSDCGSQTVKALPLPTVETISSRPSWRLRMCLTMARPRPVPPLLRLEVDADAVEALGQAVDVLARDAGAVVGDGDAVAVRVRLARRRGEDAHGRALAGVLHGVVDEVGEDLRELVAVAGDLRPGRGHERSRASPRAVRRRAGARWRSRSAIWFSETASTGRTCSVISMRLSDMRSSTSRCIRPASRAMMPRKRSRASGSLRAWFCRVSM